VALRASSYGFGTGMMSANYIMQPEVLAADLRG